MLKEYENGFSVNEKAQVFFNLSGLIKSNLYDG